LKTIHDLPDFRNKLCSSIAFFVPSQATKLCPSPNTALDHGATDDRFHHPQARLLATATLGFAAHAAAANLTLDVYNPGTKAIFR
jgi:hypothetical protein